MQFKWQKARMSGKPNMNAIDEGARTKQIREQVHEENNEEK